MRRFKKVRADPEKAGDLQAVRKAAVGLLAGRDYGSGELRGKLEAQGYEREVAAEAVAELVEGRIVDDARYAEHYVSYRANRGQGPVRIAGDLKALGVPDAIVDAALAAGADWAAQAREVRIRKFGLPAPRDWAEKGRQARFLQYRGFSSDHIRAALGGDSDPDGAT